MKKAIYIFTFLLTALVFFNCSNTSAANVPAATDIPDAVQQIIDKSCYACHNTASTDKKAKKKFDFDKLNYLKKMQAIAEWDKVAEVVIEGEMPPKKFNKKHPEKQLTRNDKQVLTEWINGLTGKKEVSLESQMNELVNQIVSSLAQNDKSKIAVMDFVNMNGQTTKLGRYMSEELTTRLYRTGQFEVIERNLLDKVVEEQKISLSGMIDESTAAELGKVLGVDAIASGTITDLGTSVKVNARLISAETGKLFSVASVEIPKNNKVKVLLSQSVAATSGVATTSGTTVQPTASRTVKKEGYIFELMEARLEGTTVICKLKVTNTTEEDKEFEVTLGWQYKTMIYTDAGDESVFTKIKIGDNMRKIYGTSQYDAVVSKIFAGTSVEMDIYFDPVSSNATKINMLQILSKYRNGFQIEFRNIPLKKE